jgi:hypothetical protein
VSEWQLVVAVKIYPGTSHEVILVGTCLESIPILEAQSIGQTQILVQMASIQLAKGVRVVLQASTKLTHRLTRLELSKARAKPLSEVIVSDQWILVRGTLIVRSGEIVSAHGLLK